MKLRIFLPLIALLFTQLTYAQNWQYVGDSVNAISAGSVNSTSLKSISLKTDASGTPYIAYIDLANHSRATVKKYNGTTWVTVGTEGFSDSINTISPYIAYISLAINSSGVPYISFPDALYGSKATVMKYNGSAWVNVGNAGFTNYSADFLTLSIDGNGIPYIACGEAISEYGGDLTTVRRFDGTSWVYLGAATLQESQQASLAIDGNNTPFIAYRDDAFWHSASARKYTGTSWTQVGAQNFSGTNSIQDISLAFDASNTPYAAYTSYVNSAERIFVMKYNGSSWVSVGNISFALGSYYYISLAIDGTGMPYIAYADGANSNKISVIKYNGADWVTVGSPGISGGAFTNSSMAITGDTAYVAYNYNGARVKRFSPLHTTWIGAVSTDWNTAANWNTAVIPGAASSVIIPSGATNMPLISSGADTVGSISLSSGTSLGISNGFALTVKGGVTDSGTVTGAGSMVLNGTASQAVAGNGTISNLILNDTAGAVIKPGSNIKITGAYTNTTGTLTTDSALTLVSNAAGTARIAPIVAGTISGKVNVQQYIPGGRRAFRFFGHPFSSSIGLSQMESYIDITGTGGSANGFTNSGSNAPSAFWYNQITGIDSSTYDPGWTAFTSTGGNGSNAWKPYEGVRVMVRGAQGEGLNSGTYTPSPVTYTLNGPVNQGAVTMPFTVGTISHYSVLGNPYPSPTDIGTPINTAKLAGTIAGSAFYVWNPEAQSQGSYVTVPIGGAYSIPGNAGFVITGLSAGSLAFTEANKTSTGAALFKSTTDDKYTKLVINDSAGNSWDVLYLSFNSNAANNMEDNDAAKLHNTALDFYSLSADSKKLSIDARPYLSGQVIPLGLQTSVKQAYTIKAELLNVPAGTQLMLHDKYLNQYQPLSQGTAYTFSVTGDAASQGDSRFELSTFGTPAAVANVYNSRFNVSIAPNPASDYATITYAGADNKVQVSVTDIAGRVVYATGATAKSGTISLPLQSLSAGYYMVITQAGSQKIVNKLVKQ